MTPEARREAKYAVREKGVHLLYVSPSEEKVIRPETVNEGAGVPKQI